MLTYGLKLTT